MPEITTSKNPSHEEPQSGREKQAREEETRPTESGLCHDVDSEPAVHRLPPLPFFVRRGFMGC